MTTSFAYVDCDVPEGQTLEEWRREREAERRRLMPRPRRALRIPRLRLGGRRKA